VTLTLPVGLFTCITGVSGSGKSTLINDTLFPIAQRQLNGATIAEPPISRCRGWNISIKSSISTRARSAVRRVPTRRPTPAFYAGA
jgi:excinuclease ABC subunit A